MKRAFPRNDRPATSCTNLVPACGGVGIDVGQIAAALRHPDVTAASRKLFVGSPCNGAPGCTPPTSGVAALALLIEKLLSQQLAEVSCANLRP